MTEVIVDPELPDQVRHELEWMPVNVLTASGDTADELRAASTAVRRANQAGHTLALPVRDNL